MCIVLRGADAVGPETPVFMAKERGRAVALVPFRHPEGKAMPTHTGEG